MKECPRCHVCLDDAVEHCPHDGMRLETALEGVGIIDGKYRVEQRLGQGGMGVVYRGRHVALDRTFALKLIRSPSGGRSFAGRFQIEARALGKLKHPNIVEVTDYGVDPRGPGLPYLVMEYLEGTTLQDLCEEIGALPVDQALPLLDSIAQAIDYAHQHGVLHRDLKPGNVFLARNEATAETAKILDFGLARLLEQPLAGEGSRIHEAETPQRLAPDKSPQGETEDLSQTEYPPLSRPLIPSAERVTQKGTLTGTPAYMAPEIVRGDDATSASDIYAFGILTYQVLVGRLPFDGIVSEIIHSHLEQAPPAPSTLRDALPAEIDQALLASLEKEPERRPRRAADLVQAIRSAWQRAEGRKWRAREIPRRIRHSVLLAPVMVLAAALLPRLGPVEALERRMVDARFAFQARRVPEPRILVVSVDEASLAADSTPLADRADEFGRHLEEVFRAGARGVALDFLLPQRWSLSQSFSQLVLRRFENLTLAAFSSPSGETLGTECVAGLTAAALGPTRLSAVFGLVNLDEEVDGVTRRARLFYMDREGAKRDSWAARTARSLADLSSHPSTSTTPPERFWIDYSVDWRELQRISWKDVPRQLDRDPWLFRGRLVLVGGEFEASGDDYHRVPLGSEPPQAVSGVVLQALIVNTILSGLPVREVGMAPYLLAFGLASFALLAGSLCLPRLSTVAGLFAALNGLLILAAFLCFRDAHLLIPMAGPLLAAALALGIALVLRSRLPAFPQKKVVA